MPFQRHHGLRALLAAAFAPVALGLAACEQDAVTDVTGEKPVLNILLAPGAAVLPGGTSALSGTRISNFDTSVPDAFARATDPLETYVSQTTGAGTGTGFDLRTGVRNSSQDPRLPALVESEAVVGDWFGLFNPAWAGAGVGLWDLFGEIRGLKPEAVYTVVLARMALDVRGDLDQHARLTGSPIEQPDSLYFVGGEPYTPGSAVTCNFSAAVGVNTSRNPVVLGVFETNAAGTGIVDCVPGATGDSPWWRSTASQTPPGAADSLPFGVNQPGATLRPGQYNYVLIYEGAYVPGSNQLPSQNPVVRIQVGPDIDANGNVINNGFAPWPATITDLSNFRNLPGGADAFAVPGTITLNLTGLPTLGSKQYAVWLHNRQSNAYALARVKVDGGAPVTSFDSPGDDATVQVVIDDESGLDFGQYNDIVVTLENGAPGSAPSDARFLYREYLAANQSLTQGAFTFGRFDPANGNRPYVIGGSGNASFFRDSMLVNLQRITPPPPGFHYASYLVRRVGDNVTASQRVHAVTLDEIGNATDRIAESEVGSFANYGLYLLVLEPDGLTIRTNAIVQESENYVDKFGENFFPRSN